MAIEFEDSGWFPTINFFKKSENWQMILEEAGETIMEEARERAIEILYSGPPDNVRYVTGSVGESIVGFAAPEGDRVSIGLQSDHIAANMIEYGGYLPTGNAKKTFQVDDFADNVWAVSNAMKRDQPFAQPRPFLRPALAEAVGDLNAEISATARMYADDL
tara:strand:- start:72 stop:554 length:483 start_codon:yes stop_codon:yes gene_type:complete